MKKIVSLIFLISSLMIGQEKELPVYRIENLSLNTKYSDFGLSFNAEREAVYTSAKGGGKKWKRNNQPYLNLYKEMVVKDSVIGSYSSLSEKINTKLHESNAVFTKDGQTVYFTRNNMLKGRKRRDKNGWSNLKIYKASISSDGIWDNIMELPFNSDAYSVGHPALNKEETVMYFTSDMPGGIGQTDIWKVQLEGNDTYGVPINLGPLINTLKKEMFPSVNGNELFFSSNGQQENFGGLDMYRVVISGQDNNKVVNLGRALNSISDDFSFLKTNTGSELITGYFSSNRAGGEGSDDIYYFELIPPVIEECTQYVKGKVMDKITFKPVQGAVVVLKSEAGVVLKEVETDVYGWFDFVINCEDNYHLTATKEPYETTEKYFLASDTNGITVNLVLEMNEFVNVGDKLLININPIYFDFDDAQIRIDAAYELNKVIAVMKKYPTLIIESGSHTDARGNDVYNLNLSTRRASSTVRYITNHGIATHRISGKGYGEEVLTNHCSNGVECSESEHQLNRRTEFVILNPDVLN